MSLIGKFFSQTAGASNNHSKLFKLLEKEHPGIPEDKLLIASCVSGLMARVAYVDFKIDEKELKHMQDVLSETHFLDELDVNLITEMAIDHIVEMAGLENHLYVKPLNSLISKDERYSVLKLLFTLAASDGEVEAIEGEEIRLIGKGLELSHQHFISARAEVIDFLKTLKK